MNVRVYGGQVADMYMVFVPFINEGNNDGRALCKVDQEARGVCLRGLSEGVRMTHEGHERDVGGCMTVPLGWVPE